MFKKLCCAFLCAVLLFSLCACSSSPAIATYEGESLSSAMYYLHMAIQKQSIGKYFAYYYQTDITKIPDFWDEYYDEENKITWSDYVKNDFLNMLVARKFCEEHDIGITDESMNAQIDALMEEYIATAGSKELLEIELAQYGADYELLEEYVESYQCVSLMRDYLVEDGTFSASEAEIREYLSIYLNFDYMLYNALDSNNKPLVDEDITDEQAEEFFLSDYVTVKHILYLTEGKTEEVKKEKKEKAEANLKAILDGTAKFDDFSKDNDDSGSEYTFTHGSMVEAFDKAAFEMEVGEVRLVETEYGYHLMQKQELKTDEFSKIKSDVKAIITSLRIKEKALAMLEKIEAGDAKFEKPADEKTAEYTFGEGFMVTKDDTNVDPALLKKLTASKVGDYVFYEYGTYGYYIFKNVELDSDDIKNYSETVTNTIVGEKFTKYMADLVKNVTVDTEEFAKFDMDTVRTLFSEDATK